MATQFDPALGDVLAGKYRVERVLGQGGMGMVVAASHLVLGHQVALKYLLPSAGFKTETIARFLREARVTARLKSAHIAKTLDMGQFDDGRPFLVMELLEGRDLGSELSARSNVPIAEVAQWVLQACEGLAEAHAAGVVHRDLKPSNLFLAKNASGATVLKVLDFGISKLVAGNDGALTSSEAAFGSPLYMSPEQLRSSKGVDVRSDVWSIGVILYEALSGAPPFNGESVFSIAQSVMADSPVPLVVRRKDVPPALSALVMRCLAKSPGDRPQSVADLADALAPFAGPGSKEQAARVLGALAARAVVAFAEADQSEKWTAASTQRDPMMRASLVRRAVVGLLVLTAIVGGAVVWRTRPSSSVPYQGAAPTDVTAIAMEAGVVEPPPPASSTAVSPPQALLPSSAPPASPKPPPHQKRPAASVRATSSSVTPQGPVIIEERSNN